MMNVGMVGVGNISGIYLKNFKETFQNVRLLAVCDLIRERAEKAQKNITYPRFMTPWRSCLPIPRSTSCSI